jgi:hypothetical protein
MRRTTEGSKLPEIIPPGHHPKSHDGEGAAAVSGSSDINSNLASAMNDRPPQVSITAAWRAEMDRRQAEYAARRLRHTTAFLRGEQPEPPTDNGSEKRGRGGTITDVRQFRLEF